MDKKRFAELERITSDYFGCHLAPIMRKVRDELSDRQAEEMRDYSTTAAGMLNFMATANVPGGDPYATLKVTGEWNSKTAEDYLAMCKRRILADKDIQKDLATVAEQWRSAVVKETGRARYDSLCGQLGCDLAYAYIDHRVEQLMIDRMVQDKMPKSSAEYIMRKAARSSLFGLACELSKSPLAAEIEQRGEAAYRPSAAEKAAGRVIGAGVDAVALGGAGSWASFAKFVGIDAVPSAGMDTLSRKGTKEAVSVEDCISKGVFGSDKNVFASFRKDAKGMRSHEDSYIMATNDRLRKKIPTRNFSFMDWTKKNGEATFPWLNTPTADAKKRSERYKDVPMVIAPGQEDAYLEEKAKMEAEEAKSDESQSAGARSSPQDTRQGQDNTGQPLQTNENGWSGLLANFGLDGFSDIGKNLGYVLAMLPDILVGLFTGKTKSLNLQNSAVPLAAIVAGMFVKNPILKMLLIGIGSANLINKAGHEALERKASPQPSQKGMEDGTEAPTVRYRQYADEPLNPRIKNPVLQGHCLVADIDSVPCTIQLPDTVVGAYMAGALPLNTLANAVLARYDQTRLTAAQNYERNENAAVRNDRIEIRR